MARAKKRTRKQVESDRVAVLTAVAKCFAYRGKHDEMAKYYAREVVRILVELNLVDASLPLRSEINVPPAG